MKLRTDPGSKVTRHLSINVEYLTTKSVIPTHHNTAHNVITAMFGGRNIRLEQKKRMHKNSEFEYRKDQIATRYFALSSSVLGII